MIQFDDQFLSDVGLAETPAEDRAAFLKFVYETLELRVGETLSRGMSESQLTEFEAIIDWDHQMVTAWIERHSPDFDRDPVYRSMCEALGDRVTPAELLCEYAATKWLEVNQPDYRDIVTSEVDALKSEISEDVARISTGARGIG